MDRTLSQPSFAAARRLGRALLCTLAASGVTACDSAREPEPAATAEVEAAFEWPTGQRPTATLHVAGHGDITLELFPELAPATVENFVELAARGFYDGTTFHRVIPDFMIQGGDPNSRDKDPGNDGEGGPGYSIDDELNAAPHERGVLSMANNGRPNSGGSQFFILQGDARHLDGQHTVFGRVASGLDVIDAISSVETDEHGRWGKPNRPITSVVIERITLRGVGETASAPERLARPHS